MNDDRAPLHEGRTEPGLQTIRHIFSLFSSVFSPKYPQIPAISAAFIHFWRNSAIYKRHSENIIIDTQIIPCYPIYSHKVLFAPNQGREGLGGYHEAFVRK